MFMNNDEFECVREIDRDGKLNPTPYKPNELRIMFKNDLEYALEQFNKNNLATAEHACECAARAARDLIRYKKYAGI